MSQKEEPEQWVHLTHEEKVEEKKYKRKFLNEQELLKTIEIEKWLQIEPEDLWLLENIPENITINEVYTCKDIITDEMITKFREDLVKDPIMQEDPMIQSQYPFTIIARRALLRQCINIWKKQKQKREE